MTRELLSQFAGIILLLGSMILIYIRRIDLTKPISNTHSKTEAFWVKIGNHVSLKTGTPALALFAIGFLLVVLPLIFPQSKEGTEYQVVGIVGVKNANGIKLTSLPDVDVSLMDPVSFKIGKAGNIPEVIRVSRGVHGFPTLHLEGAQVSARAVDLNIDSLAIVDEGRNILKIKDTITLFADQ
jgi:hypothetical protein